MQFTLECGMIAFVQNQILYKIGPNLLFHHQAPAACHQFGPNCIWHDWEKVDNVESSGHKPKQTEDWWLIAFKYMESKYIILLKFSFVNVSGYEFTLHDIF